MSPVGVYHGHRNYKFIRRTRTGIIQIEMPYGDSPVTHRNQTQVMMTSSSGNIFRVTGPLCGECTGPGEFPAQRPVTQSFDGFFDLRPNKRLSKQPWGWWFETQSWSLWFYCNVKQCCLWIPGELVDGKSAVVQVLARCHYYLSQCWPRPMSQCGVTSREWPNALLPVFFRVS